LVQTRLDTVILATGIDKLIVDAATEDVGWAWVFSYNSREYIDTRVFGSAFVGNGPFVVEKQTGKMHQLMTASPIEWELRVSLPTRTSTRDS
jgi:hypothetical protein